MNILYVHSDKIVLDDMRWALYKLNIEPDLYPKKVTMHESINEKYRADELTELKGFMHQKRYDAVITYDFNIIVAMVCKDLKVKYISWIYDSPNIALYSDIAKSEYNYIFVFDKIQYERMKKEGLMHIYYLPLAANTDRTSGLIISEEDEKKYCHDISFVGSLYQGNGYNEKKDIFTPESMAVINRVLEKAALHWGKRNPCFHVLEDEAVDRIYKELNMEVRGLNIDRKYMLELFLFIRKIAEIERTYILNTLALEHDVTLYTESDASGLKNVKIKGKVDYWDEVPKIFYLSKINLNITLRSIETGIPQRVFDIMGVGGFVMSNYQEEMEELFVPDKEIVLFQDVPELIEKVNYYLMHEEERVRIAINGYKKVRESYNIQRAVSKMLEITLNDNTYNQQ